jgi:hypothetical protein
LRRSSNGKSTNVASIEVVSSMDTRSTQLNVSSRGRPSRMAPTRARIVSCKRARLPGATIGCTTLRCSSCFGGSIAMNIGSSSSTGRSRKVMPPKVEAEENAAWFVSTRMMSLYFVTDQNGPSTSLSWKCTGSSRRKRAKYGYQMSSWYSFGSLTSI